ncbi:PREDICTED: something about silencing protein 10 isoform X2 [Ipomoea nil]|uniref:something about silencing protein 10 isoform X2 n=1 Tax=Ipomoea nil TaxID=35883 RepID=UPI00090130A7|nr:PREDICTED: something about silencing protein 10 isoform X2 [Ipomoea nil]
MGRKAGKHKKRESNPSKKSSKMDFYDEDDDMMNDEIDAFHKQRDIIPLDINKDVDEESDEDDDHPVYDLEDDDDDEDDDEDEDEDEGNDDDDHDDGLAAKISKQLKYMRAKTGGVDDEMHDESDKEEKKRTVWSRHKSVYYSTENLNSSDDDLPAEEEEVLRLQKENAKALSLEDFGLEDDKEATFEEILAHGKPAAKDSTDKEENNETNIAYEKIKKDLNALTREEQMDVVYSSAPELVGLLSELNEAHEELDNKVNPLLSKINVGSGKKGELHYLEVKRLLLLSYCQAITFYLLLKSEGQPVCDHPVISRLVDIKALLDKMKELNGNIPSEVEILLSKSGGTEAEERLVTGDVAFESEHPPNQNPSVVVVDTQVTEPNGAAQSVELNSTKEYNKTHSKRKLQVGHDDQVGVQSMEMLKIRAALEEKLKQKGVFSSLAAKHENSKKRLRPVNGQLATLEDFDDDAMDIEGGVHGVANGNGHLPRPSKLSKLVTQVNKSKQVISGDDDLPKRDDIGERRRKHELRVLAGAGINSADDVEDESADLSSDGADEVDANGETDSDLEFYKQVEKKLSAKVAAKEEKYSRPQLVSSLPETTVDGKRQISYLIEKNRGLTRNRNKKGKNPRKKYRSKHTEAVKRRKGQVREIKKPSGPYGGEASGINAGISRSLRFKN